MAHVCVLEMPDKADPDNWCDPDPGYVNGYPWDKPRCGICGRFMPWPALFDGLCKAWVFNEEQHGEVG